MLSRRLRIALSTRNVICTEILYAALKIENAYNCFYRKGQVLNSIFLSTECQRKADKMSMCVY